MRRGLDRHRTSHRQCKVGVEHGSLTRSPELRQGRGGGLKRTWVICDEYGVEALKGCKRQ